MITTEKSWNFDRTAEAEPVGDAWHIVRLADTGNRSNWTLQAMENGLPAGWLFDLSAPNGGSPEEQATDAANLRVIAASRELLAALITCESILRVLPNVTTNNGGTTTTTSTARALEQARSAIGKAKSHVFPMDCAPVLAQRSAA